MSLQKYTLTKQKWTTFPLSLEEQLRLTSARITIAGLSKGRKQVVFTFTITHYF